MWAYRLFLFNNTQWIYSPLTITRVKEARISFFVYYIAPTICPPPSQKSWCLRFRDMKLGRNISGVGFPLLGNLRAMRDGRLQPAYSFWVAPGAMHCSNQQDTSLHPATPLQR